MSSLSGKIRELRIKNNYSQNKLAGLIGVSNNYVNMWENGKRIPSVDSLEKLSNIFNIELNELLNMDTNNTDVKMIVITGGPCAGKSTAMSMIQEEFTKKGYTVFFIGESATELITSGISRDTCRDEIEFQIPLFKIQREKEKIYREVANSILNKVLIVCDRGLLDSKAFMEDLNFKFLLQKMGVNEVEVRDSYDAVFHLVTAANGAEKFYTLENNSARKETLEEARIIDNNLIAAWTGHPHYRIIDNSTDFEGKIKRLISEISSFLNEPEYIKTEKKYLIEFPNLAKLEKINTCKKVEIIQTYLMSDNNDEVRIRQRGKDGNYIYYQTIKKKINKNKQLEIEKRLTKEEYLSLLMKADPTCKQIRKTRYCLTHDKNYYEIDIYPFWKDKAVVETSVNEGDSVQLPSFINVLKDVSDDERYKNYSLSKML